MVLSSPTYMASTQIRLKSAFCHNWALLHYGGWVYIFGVWGIAPALTWVLCPLQRCPWHPTPLFTQPPLPPPPPIYESFCAITPSHGGLGMVSVRVTIVSIIGRGQAPGTLPPAVRLLNVWAVPCPFQAKAAVVNPRFAGVTLGPVFSEAGPDIIAARARGPIIPLFGTGLPLH